MDNNSTVGIINEIGDMGLGFTELQEDEKQAVISENEKEED